MNRHSLATGLPSMRFVCSCVLLFFVVGLAACEPVDPLAEFRRQQDAGNFAETVAPLRDFLSDQPDDPEANFLYGRALSMTKGSNLAMWSLRKAMKDPDWLVKAGMQLAFMALLTNDFNETIRLTTKVLEVEPDHVRALLMRANAYAHWKNAPKLALADARRVLEIDPETVEAYEPLILALLSLQRIEEAETVLAEAGAKVREQGTTDAVLAWHCATTNIFQFELGEIEIAREGWEQCLAAHPANMDVALSAIEFYDSQGETEKALETLRRAVDQAPSSRELRVHLANRLILYGESAAAESVLREAAHSAAAETAASAWMDIARLRQQLGDFSGASEAWDRAVEIATKTGKPNGQLLFQQADAYVLAGRLDRALEAAEDLPVPVYAHLIRARVAQNRAQPRLALDEFDAALRLWPDNPWARYYAAVAAEELGDFDRAIEEYRYSVRISPEATDARTRGAAILFAEGKVSQALQVLQTSNAEGVGPPDLDGKLLFLRLAGFMNDSGAILDELNRLRLSHPESAGRGLAAAAEGLAFRAGPGVALSMLMSAPGVDYSAPRYAPALRLIVEYSQGNARAEAVTESLDQILVDRSESALFQEIHAYQLESSGASEEVVRAAYSHAVELDETNAMALAGLARLTTGSDPIAALALYDRAATSDPSEPDFVIQSARLLISLDRQPEAVARLNDLLREHPFDVNAASELVAIDLALGSATQATLERALRGTRFVRRAESYESLAQVHTALGDDESAMKATEVALRIREERSAREDWVAPEGDDSGAEANP
jgi:tetratricopeptide (TPR) repeat protein